MTTKHTPGPWTVADVCEVVVCATGRTLCDVYSSPATGDEQADNDARLIAAAPDLLAACEALARSFNAVTYAAWTPEMHAAVAAIAKAKGET